MRAAIRTATFFQTSFESPWQNGVAERWVESCRHDLLDHIIAVNERHLKRLLSEYVRYYHEDRTNLGLWKETRRTGFLPRASAASFLRHGSAVCITATTELPSVRLPELHPCTYPRHIYLRRRTTRAYRQHDK